MIALTSKEFVSRGDGFRFADIMPKADIDRAQRANFGDRLRFTAIA
jgi:hypothetical protein